MEDKVQAAISDENYNVVSSEEQKDTTTKRSTTEVRLSKGFKKEEHPLDNGTIDEKHNAPCIDDTSLYYTGTNDFANSCDPSRLEGNDGQDAQIKKAKRTTN